MPLLSTLAHLQVYGDLYADDPSATQVRTAALGTYRARRGPAGPGRMTAPMGLAHIGAVPRIGRGGQPWSFESKVWAASRSANSG